MYGAFFLAASVFQILLGWFLLFRPGPRVTDTLVDQGLWAPGGPTESDAVRFHPPSGYKHVFKRARNPTKIQHANEVLRAIWSKAR